VRLAEEGSDIIGVDICGEVGDTARFYPPATKEDQGHDRNIGFEEMAALLGRRATAEANIRGPHMKLRSLMIAGLLLSSVVSAQDGTPLTPKSSIVYDAPRRIPVGQ